MAYGDGPRTTRLLDSLFQRALVRIPTADERALSTRLLDTHQAEHRKKHAVEEAARRSLIDLCRAVLNLNEFAYMD